MMIVYLCDSIADAGYTNKNGDPKAAVLCCIKLSVIRSADGA
jgi:hypothetical protein